MDFLIGPGGSPNPQERCHQDPEVGRESVVTNQNREEFDPVQQTFDASCISLHIIASRTFAIVSRNRSWNRDPVWFNDPVLGCLGVQNFKTIGTIGDANSHSCLGFIKHDVTLKGLMVVQAWKQGPAVPVLVVLWAAVIGTWRTIHCFTSWGFMSIQFHSFPFSYNLRGWLSHKHCFGPSGFCRYRRRALAWRLSSRES